MKKLLLVFIVLVLLFGCTPKDNNTDPDSSNQTVTYQENVVIYPPTDNNDTIISVSLAQKVQAEVAGYIVNDGKWELIFKAMSIDLNSTDYIAIKNNYSNYNTIYILVLLINNNCSIFKEILNIIIYSIELIYISLLLNSLLIYSKTGENYDY